ncbi:MAG TPA: hypothetical protein VMS95_04735 [Candidatus Krumholzibacteriaceae bacterium]|jgi:hypothetical protein|nr:hypothetical protein [Candidatus Krumholzibacteriaceae bacterium]
MENQKEAHGLRIKILLAVICVLSVLTVSLVGYFGPRNGPIETLTTSFSAIMNLLTAQAGNVYFMYPGNNPSDHVAYDTVMNMCANRPQIEYYYTVNDLYVGANGYPRPNVIGHGKYMVFIGGPVSQDCVKYYESTSQAPCKLEYNGTHIWWETANGTFLEDSFMAVGELDGHHDMFMLEYFVDGDGRGIFICYGYGWRGTWIGVEYLSKVILPKISQYTQSFYIFKWVDKNNDKFPDVNEVSEDSPKYVSVQAMLQSAVNMTTLQWFADACHTRGLKVTWYIGIYSMEESVNALLKQYITLGDSVQLSFGYGASGTDAFFNKMEPEARLNYVDHCMDTFKRAFGYYPTVVESYYIDAYTLTYISLRYFSVKGAVAYCNHEVFTDDFKSAGAYYMPYYPSKCNTLTPNTGSEDKIDIAIMPYIQRDATNSILKENVGYNLDPQDGYALVNDWRQYFARLFNAYINGWDQFGLAQYTIDLTYNYVPFQVIQDDLDFIKNQIQTSRITNVVDSEFIFWFRQSFPNSPCYKWEYIDPLSGVARFEWDFSPQYRAGYVNDALLERREYSVKVYEGCFDAKVVLYDNSALSTP